MGIDGRQPHPWFQCWPKTLLVGGLGRADSWAHRWKGDQVTAEEDDDHLENVSEQAVPY